MTKASENPRRALGKGLSALLGPKAPAVPERRSATGRHGRRRVADTRGADRPQPAAIAKGISCGAPPGTGAVHHGEWRDPAAGGPPEGRPVPIGGWRAALARVQDGRIGPGTCRRPGTLGRSTPGGDAHREHSAGGSDSAGSGARLRAPGEGPGPEPRGDRQAHREGPQHDYQHTAIAAPARDVQQLLSSTVSRWDTPVRSWGSPPPSCSDRWPRRRVRRASRSGRWNG